MKEDDFRKFFGLFVLCLSLVIETLNITMLNVSIGPITKDLRTDIRGFQWIIALYALVFAAFTITGGRLGDLFGRRKIFVFGAIIFGVGSYIASISRDLGDVLLGEGVIAGFGAALMAPCGASIIRATFHGKQRALAFGLWTATGAVAFSLGPLLGGWLTTNYSWRWGFKINVLIASFLIVGSFLSLDESRNTKTKRQLDMIGIGLSSVAIFSIVFGIIESATFGWGLTTSIYRLNKIAFPMPFGLSVAPIACGFGAFLLVLFAWHQHRREKKGKAALISLSIFRNRQFSLGTLTIIAISICLSGLVFAVPIYLQWGKGQDAMETALNLVPNSIALVVASAIGVWLIKFVSPKKIVLGGILFMMLGIGLMREAISISAQIGDLQPGLILTGFGVGLVLSHIFNLTISAIDIFAVGEGTGVTSTARQVGSSFGIAIVGAALTSQMSSSLLAGFQSSAVIPKGYKLIAQEWISSGKLVKLGSQDKLKDVVSEPVALEIKGIVLQAIADGVQSGLDIALAVAVICFFIALILPTRSANQF